MSRCVVVVVSALVFCGLGACASTPAGGGANTATTPKDVVACDKMCEVAGNAENAADEVARCQAACRSD